MADTVYRIFPVDPFFCCSDRQIESAVSMMKIYTDGEVSFTNYGRVTFVHCYGNFDTVSCPLCGKQLDGDVWSGMMDEAYDNDRGAFSDLSVAMPCCKGESSLNHLSYDFPCGFATFVIEVWNPTEPPCAVELHEMGKCFGNCSFFRMTTARI